MLRWARPTGSLVHGQRSYGCGNVNEHGGAHPVEVVVADTSEVCCHRHPTTGMA